MDSVAAMQLIPGEDFRGNPAVVKYHRLLSQKGLGGNFYPGLFRLL